MTRILAAVTCAALAAIAPMLTAGTAHAQPAAHTASPTSAPVGYAKLPTAIRAAPVPFAVGEELTFKATFGKIPAGTARMLVEGIELVRDRLTYHVIFTIDGGVPFFRVHDRYESWIDVETLASLRHHQQVHNGGYKRSTTYEIFPDRAEYTKNGGAPLASVANPLDDGSFIYALRVAGVRVGETRRDDRYFRPDRNPVVLTGLRPDTVTVGAGTFATTVVRPSISSRGIFSDDGEAQVWFSDDARRYPVQLKSKFSRFSLTLTLTSVKPGDPAAHGALLAALTEP